VVVLNGTGVNGLANKMAARLRAKNLLVTSVGDSPLPTQANTLIIDTSQGKKPNTSTVLTKLVGKPVSQNTYGLNYDADFIIILGTDQVAGPSTTSSGQ